MSWNVIFLLGGGFALASGFVSSGLSSTLANELVIFEHMPAYLLLLLLTFSVSILTEFMSNTASISMILPIVAEMAIAIGQNPLLFMIPLTVSSSFAFILPVATPPNAIVFSADIVEIADMMKVLDGPMMG